MSLMHKVRVYHAALAVLTVLAYLTGDFGIVHDWLGYGVAIVIALRLLWAVFNPRQLGLNRFYPAFDGLRFDNFYRHTAVSKTLILGIVITLCAATLTGVAMDGGEAIGLAEVEVVGTALANGHDGNDEGGNGDGGDFLEDIHEVFSNFLIFFVILHAGYLLLFKRPLARFMLYRDRSK
ncbi:MAG: cytochrome b [Paracoccaceae bacterium]|jgi:cytochrome b